MHEPLTEQLCRSGSDLATAGLVTTRGGNVSARTGGTILISRTGAALGHLAPGDLVEAAVDEHRDADAYASSDLVIHREIYRRTPTTAVVHAHPVSVIVLTLTDATVEPVDHEGRLVLPRVEILDETEPRDTLARGVAERIVQGGHIVAVRGHGTYACGETIEEAMHWTTALEASARILLELRRTR